MSHLADARWAEAPLEITPPEFEPGLPGEQAAMLLTKPFFLCQINRQTIDIPGGTATFGCLNAPLASYLFNQGFKTGSKGIGISISS